MKHIYAILSGLFFYIHVIAGNIGNQAVWQQNVRYDIQVALNPEARTLSGVVKMVYFNQSPDTLKRIWIHVWPNAYSDPATAFAKQQIEHGKTDFYFSTPEARGNISGLDFEISAARTYKALWNFDAQHTDIIELLLEDPLLPGKALSIQTPFTVKLPALVSRSGYSGDFFAVTQWYPKPAVYDANGWNAMPYLDQGEFYSEFSDLFNVEITVPAHFRVAASGNLISQTDTQTQAGTYTKLRYRESNVHDFAWFASPSFTGASRTILLPGSDSVLLEVYNTGKDAEARNQILLNNMALALTDFSQAIGPYPYKTCKVVIGPLQAGEGMEYPTITVCKDDNPETVFHELGHNWFYGMLASNERKHPWMDESLNTYFSMKFVHDHFPLNSTDLLRDSQFYGKSGQNHVLKTTHQLTAAFGFSQSLGNRSETFSSFNYGAVLYAKGPLMFAYLNQILGDSVFNAAVRNYYTLWRFRHPLPDDMQAAFENVCNCPLDWFFGELMSDNDAVDVVAEKTDFKIRNAPQLERFLKSGGVKTPNPYGFLPETNYFNNGNKKSVLGISVPFGLVRYNHLLHLDLSPVLGYNYYDKLYAGLLLNHHFLYKRGLQFTFMPVWSFSGKSLLGYGQIKGRIYKGSGALCQLEAGIRGQTFGLHVQDKQNRYYRVNPFFRFNLKRPKGNNERSEHYLLLNAYHTGLEVSRYKLNDSIAVDLNSAWFFNYLSGTYVYDDHHAISRKAFNLNAEYGYNNKFEPLSDKYLKTWLNLVFKHRYAKGNKFFRSELFAGVFLMQKGNTKRQGFYLSSNSGYNDYTYSEVMIGRNEKARYDGNSLLEKQLIDGNGNMRNLTLVNPSERWMLALNSEIDLPGILPLKVFCDLGFYRMPNILITQNGIQNTLNKPAVFYTAGLTLGLIRNTVEIFLPMLQSDQFKANRVGGFSIGNAIGFKLHLNAWHPDAVLKNTVLYNKPYPEDRL